MYAELSVASQTAYAQLFEACLAGDFMRSVATLPGSFAAKMVKDRKYWYFQYSEPSGKLRQIYVGPDSPQVHALMAKKSMPTSQEAVGRLARSAAALGCEEVLPKHYRVIERLADYGFFRAGGVLIGTHAFIAYGNLMGVHWGVPERTQDVDFAHAGRSLSIALPSTLSLNTDDAIQSLDMGFLPISGLADKTGATYLNPKEPEFRLDFITPLHREDGPYLHQRLGVALQPLKFMEYSLEDVQQAVIFCGDRAVIVNVPDPARYALHKLLIYGERKGEFKAKLEKDIKQAASLLSIMKIRFPWEVEEALADLLSRGPGWRKRFSQGLGQLDRRHPEMGMGAWLSPEKIAVDDEAQLGPEP